jgi:pyridoxal phosphate enzyme (YggS family)
MTPETLSERVEAIWATIALACQRVGRSPDTVTLVAVSKMFPAGSVVQGLAAGLRHFGENRTEEAIPKMAEVAQLTHDPIDWHMVGHVQSRKARDVISGFTLIHSLDSIRLADRLSRFATEQQRSLNVLLEINVSGEATKYGWNGYGWRGDPLLRQTLWEDIGSVLSLPGLKVRGLMTMAPIVENPEAARPVFIALRELRDALANDFPNAVWSDLSMGMTDDYPVAVEEGATLVRIGRAIFGPRRPV